MEIHILGLGIFLILCIVEGLDIVGLILGQEHGLFFGVGLGLGLGVGLGLGLGVVLGLGAIIKMLRRCNTIGKSYSWSGNSSKSIYNSWISGFWCRGWITAIKFNSRSWSWNCSNSWLNN